MTALNLFQDLHMCGVILTPYPNGMLHYKAPKGIMTPELLDALRQYKEALHEHVEAFEERAALAEYCGGLSRPTAEALAWRCLLTAHEACAACGYDEGQPPQAMRR